MIDAHIVDPTMSESGLKRKCDCQRKNNLPIYFLNYRDGFLVLKIGPDINPEHYEQKTDPFKPFMHIIAMFGYSAAFTDQDKQ